MTFLSRISAASISKHHAGQQWHDTRISFFTRSNYERNQLSFIKRIVQSQRIPHVYNHIRASIQNTFFKSPASTWSRFTLARGLYVSNAYSRYLPYLMNLTERPILSHNHPFSTRGFFSSHPHWMSVRSFSISARNTTHNFSKTFSFRQQLFRRFVSSLSPKDAKNAFRLARSALINSVDGFWARMGLRARLFLMGQIRPWRTDDFLALFSWIFVGHGVFLLAATTTFVSVVLVVVNSLQFQEYFAKIISDSLTAQTGFNITFESAIVPKWGHGTIQLQNVGILCNGQTWTDLVQADRAAKGLPRLQEGDIDLNWTYWDLSVDSIEVTLSFWRWLDGRGLVKSAKMKGVRGVVDRRHILWTEDWVPTRRTPQFGDFEMDSFAIDDLLVTILNPSFRPYSISVFHAQLPLFRKQWLLYDLMCADSVVGIFDNCLFSVHKPQGSDALGHSQEVGDGKPWSRISHLKVNSIPIDHMNANATGPFSWITKGNIDIDLHLLIPHVPTGEPIFDVLLDEIDDLKDVAIDRLDQIIQQHPEHKALSEELEKTGEKLVPLSERLKLNRFRQMRRYVRNNGPSSTLSSSIVNETATTSASFSLSDPSDGSNSVAGKSDVVMVWKVRLNDLKASVPVVSQDLSYLNNALIRPIVGYINSHRTSIPLAFTARMDLSEYDGAWDIYAAGLVDVLSEEIGRSMTYLVQSERARSQRFIRKITWWSLHEITKSLVEFLEIVRGNRELASPYGFGASNPNGYPYNQMAGSPYFPAHYAAFGGM